jgi:hypothetical protein
MKPGEQTAFEAYLSDVMAYYRADVTSFILDVWWAGCRQYELSAVKAALSSHIQDPDRGQWAPKLADVTRSLGGTSSDRAVMAWGIVLEAAARVGAYRDVDFGDLAVHQAIADIGGWPLICRTDVAELRHLQHRFNQAYQLYALRGTPLHTPEALGGDRAADDVYVAKGLPPPKPVHVASPLTGKPPAALKGHEVLQIAL